MSSATQTVPEIYAEARRYFMGEGILNDALSRLVADLRRHGIDYTVIGALALLAHGYPRLTEDIDLIVTPEGLKKFQDEMIGLGYLPAFHGARKRLRSTADGTSIELIAAGEYPGDGRPKPVSFPNPGDASVEIGGINYLTLEKLIELKLASGMTASDRLKDLADVQELIKIRRLSRDFADQLHPYVRAKFLELVVAVERGAGKDFEEQL